MFLLPSLHRLLSTWFVGAFETQSSRDQVFLSRATDACDLERRLVQLDACTRQRARGIVAGLYPR